MGRPLAHVPDPAGDGHDSYARHFAGLFLDTFERLGVRPDRVYWMSEVYASGEMDRYIRVALDRAEIVRDIYRRVSQRPASRRVAPAIGHLRELRPGGDHHRHRLGRGAGPLRVPSRPGGLGHRLRPRRRRLALRRPRQAALQRRLGGEVEPVRRHDRAEREGPRHEGRGPRPLGGDRPRGVRARAAAERGLRVPEHRRPEDVHLQGAGRRRARDRRGAAAGAAAPPLPAAAPQPGHRLRPGRDRCHPARLRRVRPNRRRGRRARREGRAAGRCGSALRRHAGRPAGRCCRGSRCLPPTLRAPGAAAPGPGRGSSGRLRGREGRTAHRRRAAPAPGAHGRRPGLAAELRPRLGPDRGPGGGSGWRRRPDRRSSVRTFPPWPMRWAPPAGPATRCRPRSSASRRSATSRPARRSARSTSPSWASRAGRAPGRCLAAQDRDFVIRRLREAAVADTLPA